MAALEKNGYSESSTSNFKHSLLTRGVMGHARWLSLYALFNL